MSDRHTYTRDEVELFEALVAQMAAAVRNARLQREQRRLAAAEAAARAVAAEREQAARVLEAVGDGVFVLDAHGIVQLWNHAAEVITGLTASAMRGTALAASIPEWPTLSHQIERPAGGEIPRPVTVPVRVGACDLWLSFVVVQSTAGAIYAFRDLSEDMRLEEQKSDLVATISHELRTPMAAVSTVRATTLLHREGQLDDRQRRRLLEMLAAEAKRLADITEEVLLTSQLDHGEIRVDSHPIDVADVVHSTIATMESQLQRVMLNVEIRPDLPPASGDSDRLRQVLVNLLDNAVKYSGAEQVTVRADAVNGNVLIEVADRGRGLGHPSLSLKLTRHGRNVPRRAESANYAALDLPPRSNTNVAACQRSHAVVGLLPFKGAHRCGDSRIRDPQGWLRGPDPPSIG